MDGREQTAALPLMGAALAGWGVAASGMWPSPANSPDVGSSPIQPAPGRLTESSAAASALAAAPFAKHTVGLASLSLMSTVFDVDLLIVPERIRQRRAIRSIRSRRVAPAERCQTPQVTVQRPQPTDPAGTPCPHQHESRQARCGEAEPSNR
ncbi:hypothetical protein TBKG_03232 [Mycobacterium tuberculosis '98-R604 INH-RIF-EM']|nr:hypothetical protein TBKG_03232 [Mycobacterium tuberculosis '98-R604 INH-RIF-EM']